MCELEHFSHQHTLSLGFGRVGKCQLCYGSIGFLHKVYACRSCGYFIHKQCAKLPQHVNPSIHSPHQFTLAFTRSLSNSTACYYCDKPFKNHRYCYTCDHCSINMHLDCALTPLPFIASSDHHQHVQFLCHQNLMILTHSPHENHHQCLLCQSPWLSGSAYTCKSCHNFFHKSCAELPQKIQHPFHPHHSFTLQLSDPTSCSSCCKRNFYSFHCENECNFNLGIECAFLTPTMINYRGHDHQLSFIQKSYYNTKECDTCHYSCIKRSQTMVPEEINRTQSFLFHCMECDFNLHFLCGPLSSKIKHECHVDPLILIDLINTDGSDKYYCDICEGELNSRIRVYCCADCKYVAHVHCVASESRDVELMAVGDHRWKRLTPSPYVHSTFTLRDLIDGLAQEEKDLLQTPDATNPYGYEYYRERNSRFDRFNTSIEDIERVQEFFHYDPEDFIAELRAFSLSEGLLKLLDEKHLGLKLVHVKDYMVPRTLAHILETLLLDREMKSIACSLLCVVIEKMCRTKVEVITKEILSEWYFYLRRILNITGFSITEKFLDRLENKVAAAFVGLEVDRFENDIFDGLDQKIETLKAELEKYERIRKTHTRFDRSQASEQMKWTMRIAPELKGAVAGDVLFSEITFPFAMRHSSYGIAELPTFY
ncbi:hypothetical protein UlMin_032685 [Ulmus minor]